MEFCFHSFPLRKICRPPLISVNVKKFWGGGLLTPLIVKKIFEAPLISINIEKIFEASVSVHFR